MSTGQPGIHTFLIADIRGYSRYTDEFGAEAAAGLTAQFVDLVTEDVETHGGKVVEIRGDEALAVFASARQAIRCAVALQARFDEEAALDHDLPLRVGIGIDSGEAVALEDGSFRGAALNVAARLCGRAHGGEVIVTEATYRLAGRMEGLTFSDRGRVHLKNISDPIHILQVYSEHDAPSTNRWVLMFFGKPGRQFGWKLAAGVVGLAALTAAGVVYLTAGDHTEGSNAFPATGGGRAAPRRSPQMPVSTRSSLRPSGRTAGGRASPSRPPSRRPCACRRAGCPTGGRSPCTPMRPPWRRRTRPSYDAARTSRATRASATRSRGAGNDPGCMGPTSPEAGSSAISTGTTR